jgi:hypothetical protein
MVYVMGIRGGYVWGFMLVGRDCDNMAHGWARRIAQCNQMWYNVDGRGGCESRWPGIVPQWRPMMTYFESFKAFVKAKPSDEQYDCMEWTSCAIAQWAQKTFPGSDVRFVRFTNCTVDKTYIVLYENENNRNLLYNAILSGKTFGELSAKLEEIA